MEKPTVSVIIPVYNCARFVKKSIESVLRQNIPIEIIVIDDCSTDNIDDVMENYKTLENVIYLKNKINNGVALSRNLGLEQAKGKYIAYLDADDWWADGKLKKQIKIMENNNAILSYTGRQLITNEGVVTNNIIHVPKIVNYDKLLHHNCIACSSVILLSDVAKENPMSYDKYHEDYINWLTILKQHGQAYGIDEPLLMYRLNDNGKSSNKIKSAKMTYGVYRTMGINKLNSCYYMLSHIFHGVIKYSKKGNKSYD